MKTSSYAPASVVAETEDGKDGEGRGFNAYRINSEAKLHSIVEEADAKNAFSKVICRWENGPGS